MKSSLAHNIKLNLPSAAIYMGSTVGQIFSEYGNNPPEFLSLHALHQIEGRNLKNGYRNPKWFASEASSILPTLSKDAETLWSLITDMIQIPEEGKDCFLQCVPIKGINLGQANSALKELNYQFPKAIPDFAYFISQLSAQNFFDLTGDLDASI